MRTLKYVAKENKTKHNNKYEIRITKICLIQTKTILSRHISNKIKGHAVYYIYINSVSRIGHADGQ